jgi:hypothetical protein
LLQLSVIEHVGAEGKPVELLDDVGGLLHEISGPDDSQPLSRHQFE